MTPDESMSGEQAQARDSGPQRGGSAARTIRRAVLLTAASVFALQSYLLITQRRTHQLPHDGPIRHFQGVVDRTGPRPFVTRALMPSLIRVLGNRLPEKRLRALLAPLEAVGFRLRHPARQGRVDLADWAIWVWLALFSLVLLGEGIHRVLVHYYRGPPLLFDLTAAGAILLWPILVAYSSYLIDVFTPTLVVWTLYLAIRRRWTAYHLLLLVAAFHKETMVLIPMALAYLYFRQPPWPRFLGTVAIQVIVVLGIRVYLAWLFRENPGGAIEFHLLDHNLSLNVWRMFAPRLILLVALLGGLVLKDLGQKPRGIKALAIVALPLLALAVPFGYIDEIRQYAEAYPGLVCLAFPTLIASILPGRVVRRAASVP